VLAVGQAGIDAAARGRRWFSAERGTGRSETPPLPSPAQEPLEQDPMSTQMPGMSGSVTAAADLPPVSGIARPLVSVVAPMFNEARTLPEFVQRVGAVCDQLEDRYRFELLLVDDGSTDGSVALAVQLMRAEPRLKVIELRRNFGQTPALQAGLMAAAGEIIISMDSDLQHFPEDIPNFLSTLEQGFDLVCGWRHERKEGILRRWPSWAANVIIKKVCGLKIHDFGTTFRCYRRDLVAHIRLLGEQHRFVPALAELVGASVTEIKIENIERPVGTSNYGIGRTVNVALDILFLYFSRRYFTRPLKAFGKIALVLFTVATVIAAGLLAYAVTTGEAAVRQHSGWFIVAMVMYVSALQILLAGLLAEILVRIYYRVEHEDGYVVRRVWEPPA
jgi:glycosyltransferase involved in cell wall biosynthesis